MGTAIGTAILFYKTITGGLEIFSFGGICVFLAILCFKRSNEIDREGRSTRFSVRREECSICGHRLENGRCSFCNSSPWWMGVDYADRVRDRSITTSGIDAERDYFERRLREDRARENRVQGIREIYEGIMRQSGGSNPYERMAQERIRLAQMQAMMQPPDPIIVAQQNRGNIEPPVMINPVTMNFETIKNREMKSTEKEVKSPEKRQVLNAISDLEINE